MLNLFTHSVGKDIVRLEGPCLTTFLLIILLILFWLYIFLIRLQYILLPHNLYKLFLALFYMEKSTFWWVVLALVIIASVVGYFILVSSDNLSVTGSAVIIQTNRGTYELRSGTTIIITPDGTWKVSETVVIPTTRGTITIEQGTELSIEPDPEPGTPDPNGS